jgi:hypothetical protein
MQGAASKQHRHTDKEGHAQNEKHAQQNVAYRHHRCRQSVRFVCPWRAPFKFKTADRAPAKSPGINEVDVFLTTWTKSHWPVHND